MKIWILVYASLVILTATARNVMADECNIPQGVKFLPITDAPLNGEPRKDKPTDLTPPDCPFYQWAWQTFLFATGREKNHAKRRLLEYSTFDELFHVPHSKLSAVSQKGLLGLALRTAEDSNKARAADPSLDDILQAQSHAVLIDQNGNPVWYQIHLNDIFKDFVKANALDKKENLKDAPVDLSFRTGSVELKSAWAIIDHDDPNFITTEALVPILMKDSVTGGVVLDGSKTRKVTVALLALHVVGVIDGHPEFIWATFEHTNTKKNADGHRIRDLAPSAVSELKVGDTTQKIIDLGVPYRLYKTIQNPTLPIPKGSRLTNVTVDINQKLSPVADVYRVYPASKVLADVSDNGKEDGSILSLNKNVQSTFEKLAQSGQRDRRSNYSLVGAIWLNNPSIDFKPDQGLDNPSSGFGGESGLSSMAMESFTQAGQPNCFSCHDTFHFSGIGADRLNVSHVLSKFFNTK